MPSGFSVVALLAAYNEADIIHHVVADLIAQGVEVYFLDDGSTDNTVQVVQPFVGNGVIAIERMDGGVNPAPAHPREFDWERILRRKAQLASELDADWFIHHDADEFRESPWAQLPLRDAIRHVDALGFNAIDFVGLDFWPVHDAFTPGGDVRAAFTGYTELASYDRLQIRCWKKTAHPVDLASSGGHEAVFPERNVFPLPFILRHYPIRSQAHGERKVFQERRFRAAEREKGWHVQYDHVGEGASFLRGAAALTPYDPDAVRVSLALRHRRVQDLERRTNAAVADLERVAGELHGAREALARRDVEVQAAAAEAESLRRALERRSDELAHSREANRLQSSYLKTVSEALEQKTAEIGRWRSAVESLTQQLDDLRRSASWRFTAPARALVRALRGR
jgi:hypothetical protein